MEEDNHFSWSCGCALVNTAQEAVDLPWCQGILLAPVQLSVNKHPQVFPAELLPSQAVPVVLQEFLPSHSQDTVFVLLKFHEVPVSLFIAIV